MPSAQPSEISPADRRTFARQIFLSCKKAQRDSMLAEVEELILGNYSLSKAGSARRIIRRAQGADGETEYEIGLGPFTDRQISLLLEDIYSACEYCKLQAGETTLDNEDLLRAIFNTPKFTSAVLSSTSGCDDPFGQYPAGGAQLL